MDFHANKKVNIGEFCTTFTILSCFLINVPIKGLFSFLKNGSIKVLLKLKPR